jgi:4-amino-4-deoxy-L-arabinose transferase-like glycosyltransferase
MRQGRFWHTLAVGFFVLWLFAVLAAFYVVQKPFTLATARAVARTMLDVMTAVAIAVVGAALGRRILIWLGLGCLSPGDLVWLAPGLGLGALALMSFALGLAGGWHRSVIYGFAALTTLLLARDILALARRIGTWRPRLAVGTWGRRYLAATLLLTLLLALAPPTSWDGLFYHLTGPALYIDRTAIRPLNVNIPHLAFPSLMEMLFSLAMLLRSDVAAKLLHLAYGLLMMAVVYRLSQRWQGREVGRWSLLLLASMPMVAVLAAWAYNDLALAFYQLAALYSLLIWRKDERWGWLVVAGVLSGLALGLKYTAFPLPLTGLIYLLWRSKDRWRAAAIFALLTGLIAAPWYLRNWVFTGNPVYPFVFHGQNWDAFRAAWYAHAGTGIGWHPLQILALPATMTLGLRDVNYYDGRMGPLFLALTPAVIWLLVRTWRGRVRLRAPNRKRQVFILLGGFAAVYAITWTLGVIQSRSLFQARLFLPGFAALVPLLSQSLVELAAMDRPGFSLSAFVRLAVGAVLALALVDQGLAVLRVDPLGYLVGYESRPDYLTRVLGDYYRAMEELEGIVPEDGRVLFLWEPRSYYSPRNAQPDAILDNWAHLRHRYHTDAQIIAHLREDGYTHVLLNRRGLDFVIEENESPLPMEDVERLQDFIEKQLDLVDTIGVYRLYRLER